MTRFSRMVQPEYVFLVIGMVWGVLYLTVVPPFQVADEDRHFYRACQVAVGEMLAVVHDEQAGGWLPESVFECGSCTSYMRWRPSEKISRSEIFAQFKVPLNAEKCVFKEFRSAVYSPVAYVPSALIIRIGMWSDFSPIVLLYLGRIANLVCWLGLMFTAIRLMPFFKWVFVVLALTPMSLHQAASLSADSMTNALAYVTIAYSIFWAYASERPFRLRNLCVFLLLTLCLSLSKNVFFLFCFLFLLIPHERFSSRRQQVLFFMILFAANFLACFLWYEVVSGMPIVWKPDVFPGEQMKFILSQPLMYVSIFLKNLPRQIEFGAKAFVGQFGWTDTPLPKWHFWSWSLLMLVTALTDGCGTFKVKLFHRLLCGALFAGIFVLIVTLLYIYWNPVAADEMYIVQGRYYIPIAPLFFLCLYNRRFCFDGPAKGVGLAVFLTLSLTCALSVIYCRFYV